MLGAFGSPLLLKKVIRQMMVRLYAIKILNIYRVMINKELILDRRTVENIEILVLDIG